MYTLDTNAVIYFLKADERVVNFIEPLLDDDIRLYISTVTEAELFSFSKISRAEEEKIEEILKTLSIIPFDSQLAKVTGFLRRTYGIDIADAAIAATAIFTGSHIVTRNVADFRKIKQLSVVEI